MVQIQRLPPYPPSQPYVLYEQLIPQAYQVGQPQQVAVLAVAHHPRRVVLQAGLARSGHAKVDHPQIGPPRRVSHEQDRAADELVAPEVGPRAHRRLEASQLGENLARHLPRVAALALGNLRQEPAEGLEHLLILPHAVQLAVEGGLVPARRGDRVDPKAEPLRATPRVAQRHPPALGDRAPLELLLGQHRGIHLAPPLAEVRAQLGVGRLALGVATHAHLAIEQPWLDEVVDQVGHLEVGLPIPHLEAVVLRRMLCDRLAASLRLHKELEHALLVLAAVVGPLGLEIVRVLPQA
eukprot:scaffold24198_cov73-Phaeocystis_antarctica.AAC.5